MNDPMDVDDPMDDAPVHHNGIQHDTYDHARTITHGVKSVGVRLASHRFSAEYAFQYSVHLLNNFVSIFHYTSICFDNSIESPYPMAKKFKLNTASSTRIFIARGYFTNSQTYDTYDFFIFMYCKNY